MITHGIIPAPFELVWQALFDVGRWPSWWKHVRRVVELDPGDISGIGVRRRFIWSSRLPYRLIIDLLTTRVDRPRTLEARASGDLDGLGCWRLRAFADGTQVRYVWRVRSRRPRMRRLMPVLRPLFSWNHHGVMRAGAEGLCRHLRDRMISSIEPRPETLTSQARRRS